MKTKSLLSIICAISVLIYTEAAGQVGIGTTEPDSSAELDIYSTDRGLLMPRLTTTQIFYIENPSVGLIAFNIDSLDFWYFNGKRWNGIIDKADTLNPSTWICGIDVKYESQAYQTIKIGTQCWMKENLNVGTMINSTNNQTDNDLIEKYCYNNSDSICDIYGGLYQWFEMMQYSEEEGIQGICPAGWHIPTDAEWTTLSTYLGGLSVAGGNLKSTGTVEAGTGLWSSPNTGATNESGFTALPGGWRDEYKQFNGIADQGRWWSSTPYYEKPIKFGWLRTMHSSVAQLGKTTFRDNYGNSVRCVISMPTVTTADVSDISPIIATSGGNVTSDGGASVTARGVCWSISSNPTISDSHTHDGSGTGSYESNLSGLAENTVYYVRAYAENSAGTRYGNEVNFTTLTYYPCGNPLVDNRDSITYSTVLIGTQCWFQENLKASKYRNGDPIPYCWYNNDSATYENPYGKLYNWQSVDDSRGLCPTGWHVPAEAEWTTLTDYLGGASIAGCKLKETGTGHWQSPNSGATNESGFTALPGGYQNLSGDFFDIGYLGCYWTATGNYSNEYAGYGVMGHESYSAYMDYDWFYRGNSVRCVADY